MAQIPSFFTFFTQFVAIYTEMWTINDDSKKMQPLLHRNKEDRPHYAGNCAMEWPVATSNRPNCSKNRLAPKNRQERKIPLTLKKEYFLYRLCYMLYIFKYLFIIIDRPIDDLH